MLRTAAVLLALSLLPFEAGAQAYPVKPVRIIAPFPPGGTTDTMCRIIAQRLTESLGAIMRAIRSEPPPAAGTMMRTGFTG